MEKQLSLTELVEHVKTLDPSVEDSPPELFELAEVANQLLKGKIDQAARFRAGLMAHIEALGSQMEYANNLLKRTEALMEDAVRLNGGNKLEGEAWTIAIKKNGGKPSIIIEDEKLLPKSVFMISLNMKEPYTDDLHRFFTQVVLKRQVDENQTMTDEEKALCEKCISIEPSKTLIGEKLKTDPASIQGAKTERGEHLSVTPGKVKPKQIEANL